MGAPDAVKYVLLVARSTPLNENPAGNMATPDMTSVWHREVGGSAVELQVEVVRRHCTAALGAEPEAQVGIEQIVRRRNLQVYGRSARASAIKWRRTMPRSSSVQPIP